MEWSKFKQAYKNEGIVLVLGAGLSLKSKIPLWEELIRGMVLKMDGGSQEMYDALRGKGMSLTAIASLLMC